ncbi:putative lipoprotein [Trabulsiella guamensis ATCC 49490]|uniref:Putative lipoprotein n=1 Tax=Trabulsiella guamensis ATCC 49490 TaxID=1005994 RepID=A0A084ZP89_9ENTR|nr:membrane lipoprotein lipid attachment site-containing protein [Trabulsiella guamensis]KFB99283.1 putative lipoprotein [Trabulsiella guamensis ATCC 49490]
MRKIILSLIFTLALSGCSKPNVNWNWAKGNEMLADKSLTDQQINSKIENNKTSINEVNALFGDNKQNTRSVVKKTFPNGTYSISSYKGHLNDWAGTYAHRVLFVAYDKNGMIINHDIATNNFREKNKFEKRPEELRLTAFNELNKNDSKSKALGLLGEPRTISFSDAGNILLVYSNTEITRDATSFIPIFNMIKGTESGGAERVYVELKDNKIENIYLVSVKITQGLGLANSSDYKEDVISIKKKYDF